MSLANHANLTSKEAYKSLRGERVDGRNESSAAENWL
jgi:hypothetical protein